MPKLINEPLPLSERERIGIGELSRLLGQHREQVKRDLVRRGVQIEGEGRGWKYVTIDDLRTFASSLYAKIANRTQSA